MSFKPMVINQSIQIKILMLIVMFLFLNLMLMHQQQPTSLMTDDIQEESAPNQNISMIIIAKRPLKANQKHLTIIVKFHAALFHPHSNRLHLVMKVQNGKLQWKVK